MYSNIFTSNNQTENLRTIINLIFKSKNNLPTVFENGGRLIDNIYNQCEEFNSCFSDIGKSINNSIINNDKNDFC